MESTKNKDKRTEFQRNIGNHYLYQHMDNIPKWKGRERAEKLFEKITAIKLTNLANNITMHIREVQ